MEAVFDKYRSELQEPKFQAGTAFIHLLRETGHHHHHHGLMQQYPMAFAEDLINPSAGYVPVRTKGNTQNGKDNQKYTYKRKTGKPEETPRHKS